jgi:hypothetical protein
MMPTHTGPGPGPARADDDDDDAFARATEALTAHLDFLFSRAALQHDPFLVGQLASSPDGRVPLTLLAGFARVAALVAQASQSSALSPVTILARAAAASAVLRLSGDGTRVGRSTPFVPAPAEDVDARTVYAEGLPPSILPTPSSSPAARVGGTDDGGGAASSAPPVPPSAGASHEAVWRLFEDSFGRVVHVSLPRWRAGEHHTDKAGGGAAAAGRGAAAAAAAPPPPAAPSARSDARPFKGFAFVEFATRASAALAAASWGPREGKMEEEGGVGAGEDDGAAPAAAALSSSSSSAASSSSSSSSATPRAVVPVPRPPAPCPPSLLRVLPKAVWAAEKEAAKQLLRAARGAETEDTPRASFLASGGGGDGGGGGGRRGGGAASGPDGVGATLASPPAPPCTCDAPPCTCSYPIGLLVRLGPVPISLPFRELRSLCQIPGTPAFIDCPQVFANGQRAARGKEASVVSAPRTAGGSADPDTGSETCTATVRYTTAREAAAAVDYFAANVVELRGGGEGCGGGEGGSEAALRVRATLISGAREAEYWRRVYTRKTQYHEATQQAKVGGAAVVPAASSVPFAAAVAAAAAPVAPAAVAHPPAPSTSPGRRGLAPAPVQQHAYDGTRKRRFDDGHAGGGGGATMMGMGPLLPLPLPLPLPAPSGPSMAQVVVPPGPGRMSSGGASGYGGPAPAPGGERRKRTRFADR